MNVWLSPDTTGLANIIRAGIAWRGVIILGMLALSWGSASLTGQAAPRQTILFVLGVETIANAAYYMWLRTRHRLRLLALINVVVDVSAITLAVYFTGGVASLFTWLYLAVIVGGFFAIGPVAASALVGFALLTLGLSFGLQKAEIIPPQPSTMALLSAVNPGQMDTFLAIGQVVMLVVFGAIAVTMSRIQDKARLTQVITSVFATLCATVEMKDPTMRGHSERVAALARLLAAEMGLPSVEVERLERAGLVHDIGKIYLSDDVLAVNGPLSPIQQAAIQTHPLAGYRILTTTGIESELAEMVRHHHEWFDGRGYPDGLSGDAIPLGARILAVADAMEAMTADRPYRAGLSLAEIGAELRAGDGSQFDPAVLAAAGRLLETVPLVLQAALAPRPATMAPPNAVPSRGAGFMTPGHRKAAELLYRLALEVSSAHDLDSFLEVVLAAVHDITGCTGGAIYLWHPDTGSLTQQAAIDAPVTMTARRATDEDLLQEVVSSRSFRLVSLGAGPGRFEPATAGNYRLLTPLLARGEMVAVFDLYETRGWGFAQELQEVLENTASQLATMVNMARRSRDLATAAFVDGLTGANNYRYFRQRLTEEMARSQRHGQPLTMAFIDVDDLKVVNDTYGHLAGDEALCRVANVLRANLRLPDVVARYGGDEFVVILPQTTKTEAAHVMRRIEVAVINSYIETDQGAIPTPSCSVGLAAYPGDGDSIADLLTVADRDLYEHKGKRPYRLG